MTDKLQTVINQITECLDSADLGLTIGQIQTMTRLSNKTVKTALKHMDVEFDGAGYLLKKTAEVDIITSSQSQLTQAKKRNKPFTPNPLMGYQVEKGKIKIFLDRRASSKTLTLTTEHLSELVNAVNKARVTQ
ncbi:hypothetical protein AAX05_01190 [Moraxella bovoculi]|uniref:hypothetical protein n=1 Tax=Moraxella bovoculi TaxID=386891 RepID=UPI000624AA8D|nr:hypothetical protein [Moraxella bovoculi]AKG09017.1 hypothetical protein AAX05_01190 [Moraxella bovoculi]AKG10852.1 hypothetical protein AAX07_01220 [Moraxella bovoculi]AKG14190.1 hypothetical protein AAX11_09395 [Moraxella bovoculi]